MYAGKIIERGSAQEIYSNPRHPYTVGLLKSVPRLDQPRRSRLEPIEGQPPDLDAFARRVCLPALGAVGRSTNAAWKSLP